MGENRNDFAIQLTYNGLNPNYGVVDQYFSITMFEYNSKLKETYAEGEYSRTQTYQVIP